MKDWVIWLYSPDFWEKQPISLSLNLFLSEALYALAAWRQTLSSPRVLLGANPRKSFSLHCVEDMLWKVLALTVWQQWGLSVWGPHSWLWKYDVVSGCIWACTSLPLFVWSVFKPRRSYWELYYAAQGNTSSLWLHRGSLCGLCLSGFFLLHRAVTNWECTLSHPWRTTRTEQHASSHQQISPTHPAATPLDYCGNCGKNTQAKVT